MAASDVVELSALLDHAKGFALQRQHRWPDGVLRPVCDRGAVIWDGHRHRPQWTSERAASGQVNNLAHGSARVARDVHG